MPVTFTAIKNSLKEAHHFVDAGERVVKSEKIGKSKKVDLTITQKGSTLYAYFNGEKYTGQYKDEKAIEKLSQDYLKLIGEELNEVRGKAGSSDGDDEADKNIIMQLHKVVSLRGMKPVTFENGKSVKLKPEDAEKVVNAFMKLKPSSKLELQNFIAKSPENFKKAVDMLKNESVEESVEVSFDVLEEGITPMHIAALKKAYEPMRGGRISTDNATKLGDIMDKVKSKDDMVKLAKADIPFVSSVAKSRLISVFKMKADEIKKALTEASPPFDVGPSTKGHYAMASQELVRYAKAKGGMDKNDFLKIATMLKNIETQTGPRKAKTLADMQKFVMDLDTDPRDYVIHLLQKHNLKEEVMEGAVPAKEKTVTVRHKTSGKELVVIAQKAKDYEKHGYVVVKEEDEPASDDEKSMALKQLKFIAYAAGELMQHVEKGGDFPEWMQNKLSKVNGEIESLHSSLDHDYVETDESVEERTLTDTELSKREKIAKKLPDADFKKRYGDKWMQVKMATATKIAKGDN